MTDIDFEKWSKSVLGRASYSEIRLRAMLECAYHRGVLVGMKDMRQTLLSGTRFDLPIVSVNEVQEMHRRHALKNKL